MAHIYDKERLREHLFRKIDFLESLACCQDPQSKYYLKKERDIVIRGLAVNVPKKAMMTMHTELRKCVRDNFFSNDPSVNQYILSGLANIDQKYAQK